MTVTSDIAMRKSCACLYTGENASKNMWPSGAWKIESFTVGWYFFNRTYTVLTK